jgi:hypothetical protein
MSESTSAQLRFPPIAGLSVRGDFDGGAQSSRVNADAGKRGRTTIFDSFAAINCSVELGNCSYWWHVAVSRRQRLTLAGRPT